MAGILQHCEEKALLPFSGGKLRSQQRYCFLFSKHLLITTRIVRKPNDVYKLMKVRVLGVQMDARGERERGRRGREGGMGTGEKREGERVRREEGVEG